MGRGVEPFSHRREFFSLTLWQNFFVSWREIFLIFNPFSLPQQIHVRRVVHPLISGRCREKVPTHFESMQNRHCASVGCIVAE